MKVSRILYPLFAVMLIVGLVPLTAAAGPSAPIEQQLLDRFAAEGTANFFVKMALDADLSAANNMDWNARGEYVVNALKEVAAATQAPVIAYAEKHGLTYQSYFVNNSVGIVAGTLADAQGLAALPGVAYVRGEHILSIPDPLLPGAGINGFETKGPAPDATVDWGILDTDADQFWATFGVQGDGIKVANIDTGVQYNHPALDQSYACPADPGNAACWADPSNICGGLPCDNNGHGTHTMGTMVADDDASLTYIAGMAPNANWIACKGCETNSCSDTALIGCAQWLLQPGGNTANRPDVVNNSWGGGGGDTWYLSYVQSWVAAGIFPAFSAGNSGSACSTLGSPGDYQESFASAAHDVSRNIASFSSRGPSAFGHAPYTKPNISAPGVSVCSSVPTNSWSCGYSGTSMASPHSAGAVALLWSCNPSLVGQIDYTFQLLQNNAETPPAGNCGAPGDGGNYTFGYGYLNVLNAGIFACGTVEFGTLEGYVYDQDNNPIEGANVSAIAGPESQIQATTGPDGFYTMQLVPATYSVTATKSGYTSQTVNGVVVNANAITTQSFSLTYLGAWTQLSYGTGCPDWTRFDGEFFPGDGYVYLLGGRSDTSTIGTIYRLNPTNNTCVATGATMPDPISNYTINLVNNGTYDVLCTFGGRNAAGTSTLNVQCYNPVLNTATIVGQLPAAYTGFTPGAQVVLNNRVYIFGGFRNTASPYELNRTDRWNPLTNTYTQLGNLSLARSYLDAAVVDGKIYAFGGTVFDGLNLTAQTRAEVMADPEGAGTWNDAAVADLPAATAEGRTYAFDTSSQYTLAGKIVIAGGGQWPGETAEVLTYDVATNAYDTSFPDLNLARRDHAGWFVPGTPGKMWVLGGRSGSDVPPYMQPETYDVPVAQQNTVHLASLGMVLRPDRFGYWVAIPSGVAHDQDHNPLAGVTCDGTITLPDTTTVLVTSLAPTGADGLFKFRLLRTQCGLWQFDLTDMVVTGYTYDPTGDVPTHVQKTAPCP